MPRLTIPGTQNGYRIRELYESDVPALKRMAEESGFPYPDIASPLTEAILVVENSDGHPIMAVAAKRLVEMYLWCSPGIAPHQSISAIRELHTQMGEILKTKGYNDGVEAFLPPSVSARFGRRLEKTFGWTRNWLSWHKEL